MPNRRDLLLGFAAAMSAHAADEDGTIYIPDRHSEKDRPFLLDFMEEFSFAMLVTGQPTVHITNVPTVLQRAADGWGKLYWHIAKNNPQNQAFDKGPVTVVFRGPHGYISPNWYGAARNAVPTWNFAVVHVTGTPRRITEDAETAAVLRNLVAHNEDRYGGGGEWKFDALPESYLKGMRGGIVAYELAIGKVEGKFKLSQESKEADRAAILKGLEKPQGGRDLRDFTRAYYKRSK